MMEKRTNVILGAIVSIAPFLFADQPLRGQQKPDDLQALISGVVARTDAIFSGKIEFERVVQMGKTYSSECVLAFSGRDWILRYKGGGLGMTRGNKYLEHTFARQDSGEVLHWASVTGARTLAEEQDHVPVRIGTIWNDCTKEFITKNSLRAKHGAPKTFDGVRAYALEWEVSADEVYDAFHSIDKIAKDGGVLRIYVIPEKGFALPLIEHVGKGGKLQDTYSATEFREVAPGVFFPMNWVSQSYLIDRPGLRMEFQIKKVELVNQPIPDKEFVVALPIGTQVTDAHSDTPLRFDLVPDSPHLQSVADIIVCDAPPVSWSPWQWKYALALVLAAALVATFFLKWRKAPATS